jgi:hypothetical protein
MAHDATENVSIDAEAWETAFKPYSEHQHANSAYDLARLLMIVKRLLQVQPPQVSQAIATLDDAADVLFPMSEFHQGAYELYRIAIEGRATTAHEDLMKTLGIAF